jgi:enoyl-CoA hydratase/3-hydroxyacyl-CoA dehydrogenase
MFVFKAGVVGAGTMGGEIAQVIAAAGIDVVLHDIDPDALGAAVARAEAVTRNQLDAQIEQGRLDRAQAGVIAAATLARIATTTTYEGFADVGLVIEAVPEELELKQAVFSQLDAVVPGYAILASNTSALSISEIAAASARPDRVVGMHFFYPASLMRLVEVIEGFETSPESLAAALGFVTRIRKLAIRCADSPGFVVNRILTAASSEIWRAQEEGGLAIAAIDAALTAAQVVPMGPFFLADLLGLDTVASVAATLREEFGERFYVHGGMTELVARGEFGAKSARGFYANAAPRSGGIEKIDAAELAERFTLKAIVEACLVLEEGVATAREIDLGMVAGAGLPQAPFARADAAGLATVLEQLERAAGEWGPRFEPPGLLRRLVGQGRLGRAGGGQGFFPCRPQGDAGAPIRLERRGEVAIAWLDSPPANALSAAVIDALAASWAEIEAASEVRVFVIASANPQLFCAGADIKTLGSPDGAVGRDLVERLHALLASFARSRIITIAAINAGAFGGGCELAMGCDLRIAAESARFGQPEINLGIIPGAGGTQRLPRLVGTSKALEMNLSGESIGAAEAWDFGLVNHVARDEDLLDVALEWARTFATRPPLAIEQIKRVSAAADLDAGLEAERDAFAAVLSSDDAREGIAAFAAKRQPRFAGS